MKYSVSQIQQAVANLSGFSIEQLKEKCRHHHLLILRGLACVIATENGHSQLTLGPAFNQQHSNISSSLKAIWTFDTKEHIEALLQEVRNELSKSGNTSTSH